MSGYKPFSERLHLQERKGKPTLWEFDDLPEPFRVKACFTLFDAFSSTGYRFWSLIKFTIERQKGIPDLGTACQISPSILGAMDDRDACLGFIRQGPSLVVLDVIELGLMTINSPDFRTMVLNHNHLYGGLPDPDQSIAEVNDAFKRHDLGYQFSGGQIIRVDSLYLHSEVVEPALDLLQEDQFGGALEEFMRAHRHFREGNTRGAIVDANNAFESTIRTILERRGVALSRTEKPDQLVEKVFGLVIPPYLKASFDALRGAMKGLTSVRSNTAGAGHGQGEVSKEVGDHAAAYALHLAAANIVFLIESWRALERRDPRREAG